MGSPKFWMAYKRATDNNGNKLSNSAYLTLFSDELLINANITVNTEKRPKYIMLLYTFNTKIVNKISAARHIPATIPNEIHLNAPYFKLMALYVNNNNGAFHITH